jgi:hypothetical protein
MANKLPIMHNIRQTRNQPPSTSWCLRPNYWKTGRTTIILLCWPHGIQNQRQTSSSRKWCKSTYSRIYAGLQKQRSRGLSELTAAIRGKLDQHHQLNFQKKIFSRKELFDRQEEALLLPQLDSNKGVMFIPETTPATAIPVSKNTCLKGIKR